MHVTEASCAASNACWKGLALPRCLGNATTRFPSARPLMEAVGGNSWAVTLLENRAFLFPFLFYFKQLAGPPPTSVCFSAVGWPRFPEWC